MRWYEDEATLRRFIEEVRAGPPTSMQRERWVRTMCDYSADGVWGPMGADVPEGLPITLDLMVRIHRWQEFYETYLDRMVSNPWTEEETRAQNSEGFAIALEVKRQLPDWTVTFHDDERCARLERLDDVEVYRPWFQYEITPEVVATGYPPGK